MEINGYAVSSETIKLEAERIVFRKIKMDRCSPNTPKFSSGWLTNFKSRFDLKVRKISGEFGSVQLTDQEIEELTLPIKQNLSSYEDRDIFNFDETALYYKFNQSFNMQPLLFFFLN